MIIIWFILIGFIPNTSCLACAFIPMSIPSSQLSPLCQHHHHRSLQQQRRRLHQNHDHHHQQQQPYFIRYQHRTLNKVSPLASLPSSDIMSSNLPTLLLQAISGVTTYIGLVGYYDRSRGDIQIDKSYFVAKQSQVEGAGIGLYVTKPLPEGTVLGTYPGVLRPSSKFLKKYESLPQTAIYTWRFTDNEYCIDPTDRNGMLPDVCYGGTDDYPLSYFINETLFRFISVPTLLARINEPPIGGYGCNVRSEEDLENREVVFELSRDVAAGEELFMDYGLTYDRSGYDPSK